MTTIRRRSIAGALATVAALTLGACGSVGTEGADLDNGRQLFITGCGSCHIMEDAGTTGAIGPNLDDAFRGPRAEGYDDDHFAGVVEYWIANAEQIREPIMPRNIVTGQDARDVAAYVAIKAGADAKEDAPSPSPIVPAN